MNGTKVSSATSFVMNMLPKKHSPTSSPTSGSSPCVRASSARPRRSNTPCRRSPAMTVISANSVASVRRSRYARYPASGGTANAEATASTAATDRTVSCWIKRFNFIAIPLLDF